MTPAEWGQLTTIALLLVVALSLAISLVREVARDARERFARFHDDYPVVGDAVEWGDVSAAGEAGSTSEWDHGEPPHPIARRELREG